MTKRRKVVESFAPTGGRILGVITLVIALLVLVDIVVQWRTMDGLTAGGVVVALGALVWISMIRPAVVAYEEVLVMRNLIRDVWIPWALVKNTEIRPILIVHTEQGSYRSVAVAVTRADRRAMWRSKEDAAKLRDMGGSAPTPSSRAAEQTARLSPAMHASHRIEVMAKKYGESAPGGDVRKTWAWPEIAVFGAGVLAAVIGYLAS
jgi:hypothetical protein